MTEWQRRLLRWYGENRRDLPWRGVTDPYRVWVSEVILQQTRVAQGRDYYLRFVERFPTVEALARAKEDEVLRLWQGLGYYSRARNMHAAAREMVAAGGFPRDYAAVRRLRGIGDYTAAAVCSLAYGTPVAVVDGNVYRVLSRYFALGVPIDTAAGKKAFAELARRLLCQNRAADYNQALMDFGALQCVPQSPRCDECPLRDGCLAAARGAVSCYPVKSKAQRAVPRHLSYCCVTAPEGLWLHRRESGIWLGLYEPPLLTAEDGMAEEELLRHPFVSALPAGYTLRRVAGGVRHQLTHLTLIASCHEFSYPSLPPPPDGYLAVPWNRVGEYAVPKLVETLLWHVSPCGGGE